MSENADGLARRVADAMWDDDRASRHLGMQVLAVGPGTATIAMTVTETMVNGLGTCHGGMIFTLADTACAFASNSHNRRAFLQSGQITLLAPAMLGTRLVAEARERHCGDRNGLYDIRVVTEAGQTIAEFRGHVRIVAGTVV